MSIKTEISKNKITQTFYSSNAKCEVSGISSTAKCNVCIENTVASCKQQIEQLYKNTPNYEALLKQCEVIGDYAQFVDCGENYDPNYKEDGSMSTFLLAALLLLAFLF